MLVPTLAADNTTAWEHTALGGAIVFIVGALVYGYQRFLDARKRTRDDNRASMIADAEASLVIKRAQDADEEERRKKAHQVLDAERSENVRIARDEASHLRAELTKISMDCYREKEELWQKIAKRDADIAALTVKNESLVNEVARLIKELNEYKRRDEGGVP